MVFFFQMFKKINKSSKKNLIRIRNTKWLSKNKRFKMTLYVLVSLLEVLGQGGVVKAFFRAHTSSVNISFIPRMLCHKEIFSIINFIYHYFSFQRLKIFKAWDGCVESLYEIVPKHFYCKLTWFQSYKDNSKKKKLISLQKCIFLIKS